MVSKNRFQIIFLTTFVLAFICFSGWYFFLHDTYKPLHKIAERNYPVFTDDGDLESFIEAGKHQFALLARKDSSSLVQFGDDAYPVSWLQTSLSSLIEKMMENPTPQELQKFVRTNYLIYQAGGRAKSKKRQMLVTGYYEPVFSGSLTPEPPFLFPIYSLPDNLVVRKGATPEIGRLKENGEVVPFWSRKEIEENNYLAGKELVYLRDPVDSYLLHVQGSGRIRLPDGSFRSIRFAGSNGLEYSSIGKLFVDERIMPLEEVTMVTIRQYLHEHPEEVQRVLHHNPRFIFFTWGDNRGPKGSSGEYLTPGRSAAMDFESLPFGAVAYIQSRKPSPDSDSHSPVWDPLRRFIFPQDSGAAIQGTGRLDIFWGNGPYAELAASLMKEHGTLFFLVKKGYTPKTGN